MGIQINGQTDTISASDGGLAVSGYELTGPSNINVTGIVTATTLHATNIKHPSFGSDTFVLDSSGNINIDSGGVYYDATNNRLAIGTTTPSSTFGGLDVSSGGISLVVGADSGATTRTNLTTKLGRIAGFHYTNSEEPVGGLVISNDSSANIVSVGGGSALVNAATEVRFFTGSNTTTTSGTQRATIDSFGRLLVGTSSAYGTAFTTPIQVKASGSLSGGYSIVNAFNENAGGIILDSSSTNALNITADPDNLRANSNLGFVVDGTERMRINSAGYVKFSNDGSLTNPTLNFSGFDQSTASDHTLYLNAKNASYLSSVLGIYAERSASSAYNLAAFSSTHVPGVSADTEFSFRGDGNAYADGSWTGGGADYAEYFEWSDSNPNEEDRRGISVVLDGDKIREAIAGEDPIGVISGNPSVVGDAAWNKWSGKHLCDEYGTYILEDYEVEDENGNTVVQQRRKLNPAFDPDAEYLPREQRPEWDCVGLMGKLRIRKGQITGARWIKMRDISDTVEEWLVR